MELLMDKLINTHDVWTILSSVVTFLSLFFFKKSIGIVLLSIEYFFRRFPNTRSTWIRTFAMILVSSTFPGRNWLWPVVKLGISNFSPDFPNVSAILNPLSAVITSPYWTYFRKFEFSVINWKLVQPPHPLKMKQIVPWEVIPMRNFAVLSGA